LNVTLAPFIQREKPHLSPDPAASFIKKAVPNQQLSADRRVFRAAHNPNGIACQCKFSVVFIGLLVARRMRLPQQSDGPADHLRWLRVME
jgi:hypothetical protein